MIKKTLLKCLSSYDIVAIVFHMDKRLSLPIYMRLGLVEKTRSYLKYLLDNNRYRNSLSVPDESRKIFDNDSKIRALEILSEECSNLAKAIFNDLKPYISDYDPYVILNQKVDIS